MKHIQRVLGDNIMDFNPPKVTRQGHVLYPTPITIIAEAVMRDPQTFKEQTLAQYILATHDKRAAR